VTSDAVLAVPSRRLVVLPLVPLGAVLLVLVADWSGHTLSAHGEGLLLVVFAQVSAILLLPFELFALRRAVAAFARVPATNTLLNWLCFLFGALFVVAVAAWLLYALARAI